MPNPTSRPAFFDAVSLARCALAPVVIGLALAGCSADVIRLDSPSSFSLNDPPSAMNRPLTPMSRSGTLSRASEPAPVGEAYVAPRASEPVRMAALPDVAPPSAAAPPVTSRATPPAALPLTRPAKTAAPVAAGGPPEKGEAIQIQPGDTLFGLSKRHHVAVSELMSVNGLTSPALKPGQTLYLPVGKSAGKKPLTRPADAVAAATPAAPAAAPVSAAIAAKYDGSYTVKKGDNLYGVALQMKVPLAELQQVNGITDVRKVRPGTVLKVPSAAAGAVAGGEPAKVPPSAIATETAAALPVSPKSPPAPAASDKQVAAVRPSASDVSPAAAEPAPVAEKGTQVAAVAPAAAAGLAKLRWPVKGKVIAGFGARPDGTHNDGVNLSVPLGTEVHAAEAGVVAYAGSELKGYGNLILVRYDNGWITAYAHNEEMLAKRGDKVKRGQVIGKAGKSGQVDQPQVHFELRQGSKPVDPSPFMEKL